MKLGQYWKMLSVVFFVLSALGCIGFNSFLPASPTAVQSLQWNIWGEIQDPVAPTTEPRFKPSTFLKPNAGALITIDLAAIDYKINEGSVITHGVDQKFKEVVREWLTDQNLLEVPLTIVAVPAPASFKFVKAYAKTLTVKVQKIRVLEIEGLFRPSGAQLNPVGDPFKVLARMKAEQKDPDWTFGRATFEVVTGSQEGPAALTFSIWVGPAGKMKPVDEITVKFCVASSEGQAKRTCSSIKEAPSVLKGIDSLRLAAEEGPFPDAALHLVNVDPARAVMGVFHRNDRPEGEYVTWALTRTSEDLRTFLKDTQLNVFANATTTEELHLHGSGLYNTLFPSNTPDGKTARQALEEFIKDVAKKPVAGGAQSPSIFFRLIDQGDLIPLGLMAVPLGGIKDDEPTEQKEAKMLREFIGLNIRIETPLLQQTYEGNSECLSSWAIAFPPNSTGDQALHDARMKADSVVEMKWKPNARAYYEKMTEFGSKVLGAGTEGSATALVMLSHHAKNQLAFAGSDKITSANVQRTFQKSSLAVLNGCGTVQPGAEEVIKELNARGVSTVIATSTEVEAPMAGDFFNCLDARLEQHKSEKTYTISQAYFDTLQCLKDKKPSDPDSKYGARVLKYALLGNGNLKLCLPKKP